MPESSREFPRYEFDEPVIDRASRLKVPVVAMHQPPATIVVMGRGSRPDREIFLGHCRDDDVPVMHRRGGGCAVVLDPGSLIVSVAVPLPGLGDIKAATGRLTEWMITGLSRAGYPGVSSDGFSDLVWSGRKIGGSCIYRRKGLIHYTTIIISIATIRA